MLQYSPSRRFTSTAVVLRVTSINRRDWHTKVSLRPGLLVLAGNSEGPRGATGSATANLKGPGASLSEGPARPGGNLNVTASGNFKLKFSLNLKFKGDSEASS